MRDNVRDEGEVRGRIDFGDDDCGEVGGLELFYLPMSRINIWNQELVIHTTSVKSPNANPLSTELIRIARSRIPGGAG